MLGLWHSSLPSDFIWKGCHNIFILVAMENMIEIIQQVKYFTDEFYVFQDWFPGKLQRGLDPYQFQAQKDSKGDHSSLSLSHSALWNVL